MASTLHDLAWVQFQFSVTFPQILQPIRFSPLAHRSSGGHYTLHPPEVFCFPTLGQGACTLFVLILVVDATRSVARIGAVIDGAMLPVNIISELAFEAERVVDIGEAEFNVVALVNVLAWCLPFTFA
jgi:hypothetical protein